MINKITCKNYKRYKGILPPRCSCIACLVKYHLKDEDRLPVYRGIKNKLAGQCYVASEAFYHLMKVFNLPFYVPMHIKHENQSHWFIKDIFANKLIDLTSNQFKTTIPYSKAKFIGFMTKRPSARTRKVLKRIINVEF
jgi:hypothetical protein